ncbi:P-loop containing nucleoside triphosphate hydrolase protein [Neolentinus lepideus HHB14362 ss-1]|uniref:p-loop containing nucleoside triphosphate hydrolase protein n=1 Tax=Neolentinus lepideus HHB14362 ss-1 TaxID=1314782 RepID=A0A165PX13_9AGAM|nr:P-loop containing nucleoside triphosphate hydrolase protein [Neolentinus lepideus HHB14362 ss-1]
MNRNATDSPVSASFLKSESRNLGSFLALMFSFPALRDWLQFIVVGGILDALRRTLSELWARCLAFFFISVSFQEDDPCYDWMMVWLSKHPSWNGARDLEITTRSFGLASKGLLLPNEEGESGARKLAFLPSLSKTHTMWYKHRWLTVCRFRNNTGYYGRAEETLTFSIMTRDHKILASLLREAKDAYKAAQEHSISIYISDTGYHETWRHVASRPKRPLQSIVLDPGVKELLLNDAREFLESKEWYVDRGIPFRRGYLLYGAPGTGKTSIIHSLAGELGLDVYIISLSKAGMDDGKLSELLSELPEKCIAIMEDVDVAFHQSITREPGPSSPAKTSSESTSTFVTKGSPPSSSRLTLSGLLNALDGVGAQEGRILYATTNKYHALDPALCRPGRMDLHLEFKLASRLQAKELFKCFYLPVSSRNKFGAIAEEGSGSPDCSDSGTEDECKFPACVRDTRQSTLHPVDAQAGDQGCEEAPHGPKDILVFASCFAGTIPDREFSMASLQGYLMGYKQQPCNAVRHAPAWVKKEKATSNRLHVLQIGSRG